jgi:3-methyladenine DNA glycosylase AlkD
MTGPSMNPAETANEIDRTLSSLPDQSTAAVRAMRRDFSKRIKDEPPGDVIDLALELVGRGRFLLRFVAYELVLHHAGALRSLKAKDLELLGAGLDSWGAVDCFACYLSGPAWRENQVPDRMIHKWARSKDRWWRRAALVSTVPLNSKARGGWGDPFRTLEVCGMLVKDRDDMVVKALSWALRELSRRDPKAVDRFLDEKSSTIAARVTREVRNKLATGLKNPGRVKASG